MQTTTAEILAIVGTYEGMLRAKWDPAILAKRTEWLAVLASRKGGR